MYLYPEKIRLEAKKDNKVHIILPLEEIDSIEVRKSKKIVITMFGGARIKISGFKNVHEVENKINEFLSNKN